VARIVAIAPDLLFASRIEETLGAAGHEVVLSASVSGASLDEADLLLVDLERCKPDAVVGRGVPVIGFYPHTNAELRRVAEAAGVDLVVPRSRMAREMSELAESALARTE
jgi:hypothetical protein